MSRNWDPGVAKAVAEVDRVFPPPYRPTDTYEGHGAEPEGERVGADFWTAPVGAWGNDEEHARAKRMVEYLLRNWDRLGLRWVIYNDYFHHPSDANRERGDRPYARDPSVPSTSGEVTARHGDHIHVQFSYGYRYVPPKGEGGGGDAAGKDNPLWGIDVASYQRGIDMARVAKEGYSFAVVKASEGPSHDGWKYLNPEYRAQVGGAGKAGMVVGAYHFLLEGPAKPQADLFLKTVGDPAGKLLMVDFEEYASWPSYTPTNGTLKAFVAELRRRVGPDHPILVYSGRGFWEGGAPSGPLSAYGKNLVAWDAYYPLHPQAGYGSALYEQCKHLGWGVRWGGVEPRIWQFSANGVVAGFEVDVNAFAGTREGLLKLTGPKKPPTPPAPTRTLEQRVADLEAWRKNVQEKGAAKTYREIQRGHEAEKAAKAKDYDRLLREREADAMKGIPPSPAQPRREEGPTKGGSVDDEVLEQRVEGERRLTPRRRVREGKEKPYKAMVAAAVPLLLALSSWAEGGAFDEEQLTLGLSALVGAVLVYLQSNKA